MHSGDQSLNLAQYGETYDYYGMEAAADPTRRSPAIILPFAFLTALAAASWLAGGSGILTDVSFVGLGIFAAIFLIVDLLKFPSRFGIGGIVLFGGVLIWFCNDYYARWLGNHSNDTGLPFSLEIVAKAAFFHLLFVTMMVCGLFIPYGRTVEKLIHIIPEPPTPRAYFWIAIFLFIIGISPYFLFAADPVYMAIWKSMTGGYAGRAGFTTGRTAGNFNFNWGGYIGFLLETGKIGSVLAIFYVMIVRASVVEKTICWAIWTFWMLLAFGSGVRGDVLYMGLPVVGLTYIKHQAIAAALLQRFRLRAYLLPGILLFIMLFAIQFAGLFRTKTYVGADLSQVTLTKLAGNHMFTESLLGFEQIPDFVEPFRATFPGAAVVRPIPDSFIQFLVSPIPRALWPNKPVDQAEEWYNKLVYKVHYKGVGNVSHGAVGYWYFRYGGFGVLEGGLFIGWLIVVAERSLRNSLGMPLKMLISLAVCVWLFRCFRGFSFVTLHPIIVGGAILWVIISLMRLFQEPVSDRDRVG